MNSEISGREWVCCLVILLSLTLVPGCQRGDHVPVAEQSEANAPDQEMWDSTILLSVEGRNRARVRAGHIRKFDREQRIKMDDDIQVDFFDKDGKHVSVLTARQGEVDETTQDLRADGDVLVISDDGARLNTEHLRWHQATQKILSDTLVTITRDGETVTGVGFESDADLSHWEMKKDVSGVVKHPDDR